MTLRYGGINIWRTVMDYSHIDISKFDWLSSTEYNYHRAMEYLGTQGFAESDAYEDSFSLDFEESTIFVHVRETSTVEMVSVHVQVAAIMVFGNCKDIVARFKRIARAI
jgi:hypothetical protein